MNLKYFCLLPALFATAHSTPVTIDGELGADDPVVAEKTYDTYEFSVVKGQAVSVRLTPANFDANLIMILPSGVYEQRDVKAGASASLHLIPLRAGAVQVVVSSSRANANRAQYRVVFDTDPTPQVRPVPGSGHDYVRWARDFWSGPVSANEAASLERASREMYDSGATAVAVAALNAAGARWYSLREYSQALTAYKRSRSWATRHGYERYEANATIDIATSFSANGQPDSALSYFQQAAEAYDRIGDKQYRALSLVRQAQLALSNSQFKSISAPALLFEALRLQREAGAFGDAGVTATELAGVYRRVALPDSTRSYLEQAVTLYARSGNNNNTGTALFNLAAFELAAGKVDSAGALIKRSLELHRAAGDSFRVANALATEASIRARAGVRDSAIFISHTALKTLESAPNTNLEATLYNNIGVHYHVLGRADSALTYLHRSLALRKQAKEPDDRSLLLNISQVQAALGRPDSAEHYRRLAPDPPDFGIANVATLRFDLARLLLRNGAVDSALAVLHVALAQFEESDDSPGQIKTLMSIGEIHLNHYQQADSAFDYFDWAQGVAFISNDVAAYADANISLARALLRKGDRDKALDRYRSVLESYRLMANRRGEAMALEELGDWFFKTDVTRTVAYYDSAASVYASLRQDVGNDANRIVFAEQHAMLAKRWAHAWTAAGDEMSALVAIERGRAQALLDLMRGTRVIQPGANLREEGAALLRALGSTRSTLLSYSHDRDTLFLWYAPPNGRMQLHRTPVADTTLVRLAAELRAALDVDSASMRDVTRLEREGPTVRSRAGNRGYGTLLQEIGNVVLPNNIATSLPADGDVLIIPDGALAAFPFGAIPFGGSSLGVARRLRYAPSITAAVEADRRPSPQMSRSTSLVVGNPEMPTVTGLDGVKRRLTQLPGSERESINIAKQLQAEPLTGAAAGEATVLKRMQAAPIIHLATHGYAFSTEARARHSFVALTPEGQEDGLLTVGEVLDEITQLRADLVVLSACQTGLGDRKQAEGTVGMQRAFLAKGARSVLVSLWSVSDPATDLLMRSFYGYWTNGDTKTEALRKAQADVAKQFPNPRYWAAFQLVGAQ